MCSLAVHHGSTGLQVLSGDCSTFVARSNRLAQVVSDMAKLESLLKIYQLFKLTGINSIKVNYSTLGL